MRERHAKLITDRRPYKAASPHRHPHTSYIPPSPHSLSFLHLQPHNSFFVAPLTNTAPNKPHHKSNRPPPTVRRWCKQIQLLGRDRGASWLQSGFSVPRVYSNTSLPSRSSSPLVVIFLRARLHVPGWSLRTAPPVTTQPSLPAAGSSDLKSNPTWTDSNWWNISGRKFLLSEMPLGLL